LYNSSPAAAAASSSVVVEESLIPDVAANANPLKVSPHKTAEYKKNKTVCLSHCSSRAQKKKPHEANRTKPNQTNKQTNKRAFIQQCSAQCLTSSHAAVLDDKADESQRSNETHEERMPSNSSAMEPSSQKKHHQ
jgi:hypothetical protein